MSTRCPCFTASSWISSESVPYSSAYVARRVLAGSLPTLRTGTNPQPSRSATTAPKMKPRLSMPTTRSTSLFLKGAIRLSIAVRKPAASRSSVVMS